MLLRKDLTPEEYVTSQQIRSLYSRWSKLYKQGKLPTYSLEEHDDDDISGNESDKSEHEDDAEEYEMNLHDVATELRMPWKIDDRVAVVYDKQWYPGVIVEVHYYVYIYTLIYYETLRNNSFYICVCNTAFNVTYFKYLLGDGNWNTCELHGKCFP